MNPPILADNFAQRPSLLHAHDWFSRSDPTIFITVCTLFGLIVLGLIIASCWQRIQEWSMEPARRQPRTLFRKLLRHLALSRLDRWHLWRLARRLELPHPAALLISDAFFNRCVEKAAQGTIKRRALKTTRYRAIRTRLFPDERS